MIGRGSALRRGMVRLLRVVACALLVMQACSPPPAALGVEASIRDEMQRQADAWNRGDIPGFMAAYADTACFISLKERTCGKALVTARYMKRYPDASAMGRLDFGNLEVLPAGADHAWCTGTWRLVRSADTLSGGFSLLWGHADAGWRILRDHTY